jgi:hypothetical protein
VKEVAIAVVQQPFVFAADGDAAMTQLVGQISEA